MTGQGKESALTNCATHLLNAGAERVDIKALLGHETVATTQIYANVGQERMEKVVARL